MKKHLLTFTVLSALVILLSALVIVASCGTTPKEEPSPPQPKVENPGKGPSLAATIPEVFPDIDKGENTLIVSIFVAHPVPVSEWSIRIYPIGDDTVFYESKGTNNPPAEWRWDGRGSKGEMATIASEYRFVLNAVDTFKNSAEVESTINVGVFVSKDDLGRLRIVVPSIIFPPNSANFSLLSQEDQASNRTIIGSIANVLKKFADYKITVEGHANPTTPEGLARIAEEVGNPSSIGLMPLSVQRARAVVDSLVTDDGIERNKLTAIGMGGTRTVADYSDSEVNWQNRRVEFLLER